MEARQLIEELRKMLSKGVEVALATALFVLKFPDGKIKVLDIGEFKEAVERVGASESPVVSSTRI